MSRFFFRQLTLGARQSTWQCQHCVPLLLWLHSFGLCNYCSRQATHLTDFHTLIRLWRILCCGRMDRFSSMFRIEWHKVYVTLLQQLRRKYKQIWFKFKMPVNLSWKSIYTVGNANKCTWTCLLINWFVQKSLKSGDKWVHYICFCVWWTVWNWWKINRTT